MNREHRNFYRMSEILEYSKKCPITKTKTFRSKREALTIAFKSLLKKDLIYLRKGIIWYYDKQTNSDFRKIIEKGKIKAGITDFTINLLIKNDWLFKINPLIVPILPLINNYLK